MLAASKTGRALYLALNRAIALEARQRFPAHLKCATTHSIALRGMRKTLAYPEWKLTEPLASNLIVQSFRFPATISSHSGVVLEQRSYAAILRDGIKRFLHRSDKAPGPAHVPCYGVLETLTPEQF
jgi:hypothetical protein